MARRSSSGSVISVNFKGVEGKRARVKPGEYGAEVEEVERIKQKGKDDYLKWVFILDDDAGKAYYNTSLSKQSLWNLRGLLEAMGEEVPDDEMGIDLTELVGKRVGLVIEEEEYEGKKRPSVVDFFDGDEVDGSKDKGKKDKGKKDKGKKDKGKKDKGKKEPEKLVKSDVEAMDRDDLESLIGDHDLEIDVDDRELKKDSKLLAAVLEALEDKDLLEEDDAEAGDKVKKSEVKEMSQDELESLNKEHELKLDFDDYSSLRKMVAAVVEALEEKDLLDDE